MFRMFRGKVREGDIYQGIDGILIDDDPNEWMKYLRK